MIEVAFQNSTGSCPPVKWMHDVVVTGEKKPARDLAIAIIE